MDRAFASGASGSAPSVPASPSIGYPTAGNPGSGTPATKPGEYWFYMITEEIRKVITDAGLTPAAGNVTQLSAAIQNLIAGSTQPAGSVIYVAKNSAPTGYLKANGAAVSRTTYSALFAAIGTTFGAGDGSTTFNVPDLRGEFLRGWDDGRGVDTGRSFGSAQAYEIQSHTHAAPTGGGTIGGTYEAPTTTQANYDYSPNVPTSATGGTETRPRNVAVLACIKF